MSTFEPYSVGDATHRIDFHERRRTGIGGSDVAAILGRSKWSTALKVYLQKRGLVEQKDDNARMEMGRRFEPVLLDWYAEVLGVQVIDRGQFLRHPEHDFLVASTDMRVTNEHGDTWVVDAKKVHYSLRDQWGDEFSDWIPQDAFWQGHHYCFVANVPKCDFVVQIGDNWPPKIMTVQRDDELYALVVPRLFSFWHDHVLAGVPPEPDFADDKTVDAVKAIHPPVPEKLPPVALSPAISIGDRLVHVAELAQAHTLLKQIAKQVESRARRVEAALRVALGDAKAGTVDDVVINRIYNKGGYRPAHEVAPYDYLQIKFPPNYEMKITERRIAALLEGEMSQ